MRNTIKLYLRLVGIQIRSQLQYRVSFFMDLISAILVTVFEFGSLALVFSRFQSLKGWSLGEVAFLYGLVEFAFGIMDMTFSGFDPQGFGQEVRKGSFDQRLLRPVNITVQVLGAEFLIRRFGKILIGGGIVTLALKLNPIHWTLGKILYLPIVVLSMVLFFGGLYVIGATITFWTVESIEVVNIFTYGGSYLISHPMHIYQNWLRNLFTFVLPAIFLNYYPALYFLDKPDPLHFPSIAPFLSPVAGGVVFGLAMWFWKFGVRHYQSTGT